MYKSLKEYADFLDSCGELKHIKEFTDPVLDIAKATYAESRCADGGKAVLFENTGTDFQVLTNVFGSERRIKAALGLKEWDDFGKRLDSLIAGIFSKRRTFIEKIKFSPAETISGWMPVDFKGQPPCHESIQYIAKTDQIPTLKCLENDEYNIINCASLVVKNPLTGEFNTSDHIIDVLNENTLRIRWEGYSAGAKYLADCTHRLPAAIFIGGDPVYSYIASALLNERTDGYLAAGFLRGKPVELAPCFTQELSVPADCDFVLEGYIQKSEEKMNGYPKFHITCITHKLKAIYLATTCDECSADLINRYLATEKLSVPVLHALSSPEINDLHISMEGNGHIIVKIKKYYEEEPYDVACRLWSIRSFMRFPDIVVVDCERDIREAGFIEKAVNSSHAIDFCGKSVIDATGKL